MTSQTQTDPGIDKKYFKAALAKIENCHDKQFHEDAAASAWSACCKMRRSAFDAMIVDLIRMERFPKVADFYNGRRNHAEPPTWKPRYSRRSDATMGQIVESAKSTPNPWHVCRASGKMEKITGAECAKCGAEPRIVDFGRIMQDDGEKSSE